MRSSRTLWSDLKVVEDDAYPLQPTGSGTNRRSKSTALLHRRLLLCLGFLSPAESGLQTNDLAFHLWASPLKPALTLLKHSLLNSSIVSYLLEGLMQVHTINLLHCLRHFRVASMFLPAFEANPSFVKRMALFTTWLICSVFHIEFLRTIAPCIVSWIQGFRYGAIV